jgi:predicted DNA-binding protein
MTTDKATYKGEPLTDEVEERLAAEALAELAAMSDEEREAHKREPGALAKRLGRPRLGDGQSVLLRARLSPDMAKELNQLAADTGKHASELVRLALEVLLAGGLKAVEIAEKNLARYGPGRRSGTGRSQKNN